MFSPAAIARPFCISLWPLYGLLAAAVGQGTSGSTTGAAPDSCDATGTVVRQRQCAGDGRSPCRGRGERPRGRGGGLGRRIITSGCPTRQARTVDDVEEVKTAKRRPGTRRQRGCRWRRRAARLPAGKRPVPLAPPRDGRPAIHHRRRAPPASCAPPAAGVELVDCGARRLHFDRMHTRPAGNPGTRRARRRLSSRA